MAAWAVVDDGDYADISAQNWYLGSRGYAMRQIYRGWENGKPLPSRAEFMHRRVMGLERGDPRVVDHINRDKLDNRRSNLRVVTPAQNGQNLAGGHGKSGVRGVHWHKTRQKWFVRVCVGDKQYWGRTYADLDEATAAAVALRAKHMTHSTN